MPEATRVRAYEVTWSGHPDQPSYVRATSAGRARMDRARVLVEVCYERSIGDALKQLRARRIPDLDAFPVNASDRRRTGDPMGEGFIPTDLDNRPVRVDQAERDAAAFNRMHPVGIRVRYWTGARRGEGREGVTSGPAYTLCGTAMAAIVGISGGVALTHVDALGDER